MTEELCVRVKQCELRNLGCAVLGKVLVGSLSAGEDVLFCVGSELVKTHCRGVALQGSGSTIKMVDKVCAGDEVFVFFDGKAYCKIRGASFMFREGTRILSRFCLSVQLPENDLENLKRPFETLSYETIKITELDFTIIGDVKMSEDKIIVNLLYPVWFQPGFEVIIFDKRKELLRGKIAEL